MNSENSRIDEDLESRSLEDSVSLISETKPDVHQRKQASPMNLKQVANDSSDDVPLDLSINVLDLSKISKQPEINENSDEHNENQKEFYNTTNPLLLTRASLESRQVSPPTSLEALYANAHANMIYSNLALGLAGAGLIAPNFFNRLSDQGYVMKERLQKKLVRGLQTSGGILVEESLENTGFNTSYPPGRNSQQLDEQVNYSNLVQPKFPSKVISPRERISESPSLNSIKMVIKNGALMTKQKQRRYRTERPFTCKYCSKKFTLKTNVTRHMKQQHNALWHQRPRGGHSTGDRPPARPQARPPGLHQDVDQTSQTFLNRSFPYEVPLQKEGQRANTRSTRNSSSPDGQDMRVTNNNSFSTRNVPERSYKCNQCPCSTFATLENLKKHRSTKHSRQTNFRSETSSSDPQNSDNCQKQNDQSSSSYFLPLTSPSTNENLKSCKASPRSSPEPADTPFKCHVPNCDNGFADRQDCLDHIKMNHKRDYEILVSKGYLQIGIHAIEEQPPPTQHSSDGPRFLDYKYRKVVCAFCMRRLWSAEDLRRHARTHTGEQPFSCDICDRRFSIRHNMFRHRKQHEAADSTVYPGGGDEEISPTHPPKITPRSQFLHKLNNIFFSTTWSY